jgi:type VI secretion system secreted protein VgrG
LSPIALTTTVEKQQALKIQTPLGKDAVAIREFKGTETISQPFEFSAFVISTNRALPFEKILGHALTVSFDTGAGIRYFNGIAGEIWQRETARIHDDNVTVYEIKFYPRFWLLKFTSDCRIFQNMSALHIIQTVLKENGVIHLQNLVTKAGQVPREYCVQYNETCYDFVCRLMEEEGIYYYFTHEENLHTMVLGDSPNGHRECPVNNIAEFFKGMGSDYPENIVYQCKAIQRVTVSAHALGDYNFTTATTPLYAKIQGKGIGGMLYTYPGYCDHEDKPTQPGIEGYTYTSLDRDLSHGEALEGRATHPFLTAGHQFNLQGYDRPGSDGPYVVHTVKHTCTANTYVDHQGQDIYQNEFTAFPLAMTFRPPRITPKPRIYSTQTARVTGKEGEEIWTDEYGRIKVKFHWDESGPHAGPKDDKSSCWLRVSEGWAGANWGILFTPRIGMEVLVTFLEGDPDRPLVTGCVWNSQNRPPYLPLTPTKSTIKSHSTKGGSDNEFNEFRYEDLKGSEQVYLRAQKDFDKYVIQNFTEHIEHGSQWTWIDRGDREVAILAQQEAVPKKTPEGQELPAGKGDYNLEITGGCWNIDQLSIHGKVSHNHYIVHGDYNYQIDQGDVFKLQKSGNFFQQLDQGNYDRLLQQGHESLTIGTGDKRTYIQQGDESIQIAQGHQSVLLNQGSQFVNLKKGNRIKVIDQGGDYELIKQGSKYSTLQKGDNIWKIDDGHQQIVIVKGNREKSLLDGNETIYINGDVNETVTKNYQLVVLGDLTIKVMGNIHIVAQGNIEMTSAQSISLTAAQDISLTAGLNLTTKAGMELQQEAGMNMSLQSGMNLSLTAGMDIDCHATASVTIEAALDTSISAGIEASLEGGASTTVESGGSVELVGGTVLLSA